MPTVSTACNLMLVLLDLYTVWENDGLTPAIKNVSNQPLLDPPPDSPDALLRARKTLVRWVPCIGVLPWLTLIQTAQECPCDCNKKGTETRQGCLR